MTKRTSPRVLVLAALLALGVPVATASPQALAAPHAAAGIHPGGEVNFGNVSCEIGAVMRQGHNLYLAIPGSCGGIHLGKVQDGCSEPLTPVGSPVSIQGARHHGLLVYNSFTQMQRTGVTDPNRCYYNDLALVRVNRHDRARVSAAIPGVGVPSRVVAKLPSNGSALRVGATSAKAGATHRNGWELDLSSPPAMWKKADCGSPVTIGKRLVGMLLVLPKGPIPGAPVAQAAAQTYNLSRAIKYLRTTPHFHHAHVVSR